MKNKYIVIILATMLIILINPKISAYGAANGLGIWMNTIIPTLYPFIIISNLLVKIYGKSYKNKLFLPLALGILCGYPVGATLAKGLLSNNDTKNAQFVLNCGNLPSPMFILVIVIEKALSLPKITSLIIYTPIFFMILFFIPKDYRYEDINSSQKAKVNFIKNLDECVYEASIATLKIGGYIILFSMLSQLISSSILPEYIKPLVISFLEITNGIFAISGSQYPYYLKVLFIMCATSFGGLCTLMQTYSVIGETELSIKKYIESRVFLTFLTLLCTLLYLFLCSIK